MAEMKTKPHDSDVEAYLNAIEDEQQRADAFAVLNLMRKATGTEPKMWGNGLIGFGQYHYKYPSGREGDWFLTGFAPRKNMISISIMSGLDRYGKILSSLGKFKTGKSCLNVKRLDDVDLPTLGKLVQQSVVDMKKMYK